MDAYLRDFFAAIITLTIDICLTLFFWVLRLLVVFDFAILVSYFLLVASNRHISLKLVYY